MPYEVEQDGTERFGVSFTSTYMFGDFVSYKSEVNGEGQGMITDIVLQEDGQVYYVILVDGETARSGIYPEEIRLIRRDSGWRKD